MINLFSNKILFDSQFKNDTFYKFKNANSIEKKYILVKLMYINSLFHFIQCYKFIPYEFADMLFPKLISFTEFKQQCEYSDNILLFNKFRFIYNYFTFYANVANYHSDFTVNFAVKCLCDDTFISCLAKCQAHFDCASKNEIECVLKYTDSQKIIFANPYKTKASIVYSKSKKVQYTTFDSYDELIKLYNFNPDCNLILRINVDSFAKINLSTKFGIYDDDLIMLLESNHCHLSKIVGISFHVGSDSNNSLGWLLALEKVKKTVKLLSKYGINIQIIDLGGGFNFYNLKLVMCSIFENYGDFLCKYKLIFEPGRSLVNDTVLYIPNYEVVDSCAVLDSEILFSYFRDSKLVNRTFYYISKNYFNDIVDSEMQVINTCKVRKYSNLYNMFCDDEIIIFINFGAYTLSISCEKSIRSFKIYI